MSGSIVPRATPAVSPAPIGLIDAAFRRAVLARMGRFPGAAFVVLDGGESFRIGSREAGAPALRLTVDDARFYRAVALGGSLGAAEAWLRGWWRCEDLTALLRFFARNEAASDGVERGLARVTAPLAKLRHRLRGNTRRGSRRNIVAHYDLGNDFFGLFLDETMTYSCGVFPTPDATLAEASVEKLDRICRRLDLRPEHHVLEIGGGWGSFAIHAAHRYGCRVTTTTISPAQHGMATARVREAGVADRVTVRLDDYRDLSGTYDRLVSIEMIEAVGHEHLDTFFGRCAALLRDDGAMALQAITMPDRRYRQYRRSVDFIQRYVFPGSCVPSLGALAASIGRATDMRVLHLEDIGRHYAETLRRWRVRFLDRVDEVRALGYGDEMIRLWEYYLCYCEAGFAERYLGDVQMILARPGHGP